MKTFLKHCLILVAGISLSCSLGACHRMQNKKNNSTASTFTINTKSSQNTLYFSGIINPINETPVTSPIEGSVNNMHFSFGQSISKGQALFDLVSAKQQSDFQNALTDYLKAKQSLNSSQNKMQNSENLFKQGIESKNDYDEAKTNFYLDQLAFSQAKSKLEDQLKYHRIDNLESLSISDINAVNKALNKGLQTKAIKVYAPESGIALFSKDGDDSDKTIQTGSQIKSGQVLVNIGDFSGAKIQIDVNEVDINQIRIGQPAEITSIAFPNITLQGKVDSIDSQASAKGNIPSFSVTVVIPKLTAEQQKVIHVGMSAKVAISIQSSSQILVPLEAVFRKNGQDMVTVKDKQTGQTKDVVVKTGETTLDDVVITSGLKSGDEIVIPH